MRIPGAERALSSKGKTVQYLLNFDHPDGASKARVLGSAGFDAAWPDELEQALRAQHLTREARQGKPSPFGVKYEISYPFSRTKGAHHRDFRLDSAPRRIVSSTDHNHPGAERMTIELFSRVILTRAIPEEGLQPGDVATVVEAHRDSSGGIVGYEVELFSANGSTLAVASVAADAVRNATPSDRLTTRVT